MAVCATSCVAALPTAYAPGCGITPRQGGVKRVAFAQCDHVFTTPTSAAEWQTAVTAGEVVLSGLIIGQKPKGSFTKNRFSSCAPEQTTGGTKTVTFRDYNTASTVAALYTFWNTILATPSKFKMYYQLCNNDTYGPINDFDLEIDEVSDETSEGNTFMDGTLTWQSITMLTPFVVNLDSIS